MDGKARIIEPMVEEIKTALRACAVSEPGETYPCEECYLHSMSRDGYLSTGQTCFMRLALDAVTLIDRLNDFEHSQCARLLEEIGRMRAGLELAKEDK